MADATTPNAKRIIDTIIATTIIKNCFLKCKTKPLPFI